MWQPSPWMGSAPWQPDAEVLSVHRKIQLPLLADSQGATSAAGPPPRPALVSSQSLWLLQGPLLGSSEAHGGFTSCIFWDTAASGDSFCPLSDLLAGLSCYSLQCFFPWPHKTSLCLLGGPTVSLLSCRHLKFSQRFLAFSLGFRGRRPPPSPLVVLGW